MEEDAHPEEDRVGGDERADCDPPKRAPRPDLAGDQARQDDEPEARCERDELPRSPRLGLAERDRLVETEEGRRREQRQPRAPYPAARRGHRGRPGPDDQQPEAASRPVSRGFQVLRRNGPDEPLGGNGGRGEERRRGVLVIVGLAR
jgi:hypothetical protein